MSAPDSITVTVADHNGVAVLSIGGEIDLITAAALEEAIGEVVADNPTALVIDLSAVEFLGSVGLKILAATSEKIGQSVKFGVVARGSVTRRPIHLMGLDKTFRLVFHAPRCLDWGTGRQDRPVTPYKPTSMHAVIGTR
ncbi:anti-anti-sigma factor RsfB [Mycobacterium tuberculosis]|nr:anti-anti-sigma factor RsfB [Mycobacterium tuberculosis]